MFNDLLIRIALTIIMKMVHNNSVPNDLIIDKLSLIFPRSFAVLILEAFANAPAKQSFKQSEKPS